MPRRAQTLLLVGCTVVGALASSQAPAALADTSGPTVKVVAFGNWLRNPFIPVGSRMPANVEPSAAASTESAGTSSSPSASVTGQSPGNNTTASASSEGPCTLSNGVEDCVQHAGCVTNFTTFTPTNPFAGVNFSGNMVGCRYGRLRMHEWALADATGTTLVQSGVVYCNGTSCTLPTATFFPLFDGFYTTYVHGTNTTTGGDDEPYITIAVAGL